MLHDLASSLKLWRIWLFLTYEDMKTGYRNTLLGPFWPIINILFFAVPICILYNNVYHKTEDYYLYVFSGLIVWSFISISITRGISSLIQAGGYLTEIKLPVSLFLLKTVVKESVSFFHVLIAFCLYLVFSHKNTSMILLLTFPGVICLVLTLYFWCFSGSILALYFRDVLEILPKLLRFLFLVTPVIWEQQNINQKYHIFVQLNPMTVLVNIVRKPLLGILPTWNEWLFVLALCFMGFIVSLLVYQVTKNKLIFLI